MQTLILTLHIIVCFLLVILILLQSGKEGMGVIFGGGNSTVFGSTGAGGILAKLTTLMAIIFVITSLSYTYVTSSHTTDESTVLNVQIEETAPDAQREENKPATPPAATEGAAPLKPAENTGAEATPATEQKQQNVGATGKPEAQETKTEQANPAQPDAKANEEKPAK